MRGSIFDGSLVKSVGQTAPSGSRPPLLIPLSKSQPLPLHKWPSNVNRAQINLAVQYFSVMYLIYQRDHLVGRLAQINPNWNGKISREAAKITGPEVMLFLVHSHPSIQNFINEKERRGKTCFYFQLESTSSS